MVEKIATRVRRPIALLLALLFVVYSAPIASAAEDTYSVEATVKPLDGEHDKYGGTVQINDGEELTSVTKNISTGEETVITIKPTDARFAIDSVTDKEGTSLLGNEGYEVDASDHVYTVSGDTQIFVTFERVAYSVKTSVVGDSNMGSVVVTSGDTSLPEGFVSLNGSTVTIKPTDARYAIKSVTDGDTYVDLTNSLENGVYTINSDTNLVVEFERVKYKVDVQVDTIGGDENPGGTATIEGDTVYYIGLDDAITANLDIVPKSGYVVEKLTVGNVDKTSDYDHSGKYTLSGITADTEVEVTFIKTHEVSVSVTDLGEGVYGGTATTDNTVVKNGSGVDIKIVPDEVEGVVDYAIKSITVNDVELENYTLVDGKLTLTNITEPKTVVVTFVELHDLTISADTSVDGNESFTITDTELGGITLGETLRVEDGTELVTNIKPDIGNVITSVKIDGDEQLDEDEQTNGLLSYDFTYTVEDDAEIVITNVERDYDVKFLVGANGSITYAHGSGGAGTAGTVVPTKAGDDITLTITPDVGYKIVSVTISHNDGNPTPTLPAEGEPLVITLEDISKAAQVEVEFAPRVFNIGVTYGANGSATINGGASADLPFATNAVVDIVPDIGYEVDTITVDGVAVADLAGYDPTTGQFTHLITAAKDVTINVTFKLRTYAVSATVANGIGGTVTMTDGSGTAITEAKHFDEVVTVIDPTEGYRVKSITYNQQAQDLSADSYAEFDDNSSTYTIEVDCETVIVVEFEPVGSVEESAGFTLTPTVGSKVDDAPSPDANADYRFYTNDVELTLAPAAGYDRIRVKFAGDTAYGEWAESIEIDASTRIAAIEVKSIKGFDAAKVAQSKPIVIVKDTDAPSVSVSISNRWVSGSVSEVTLNGSSADAASTESGIPKSGIKRVVWSPTELDAEGITASPNEATLLENGNYSFTAPHSETYYIYSQDYAGNVSAAATVTVPRDSSAPQITAFVFESDSSINYTPTATISSSTITLTVSVTDPGSSSGLNEMSLYYREPGEGTGTLIDSERIASGSASFTLSESIFGSEKEIYVEANDSVGNSSGRITPTGAGVRTEAQGDSVIIDSSRPTVSISGGGDGWVNSNVTFNISAEDNDSGLESVTILVNGVETSGGDFSGSTPSGSTGRSFSVTASQQGNNTVSVEVVNKAGLSANTTASVNIDQVASTITSFEFKKAESSALDSVLNFLTFGLFTNDKVDVTVTAADGENSSGVRDITLYIDGEEFETKEVVDNQATFTLPADVIAEGELLFNNVISATATDIAGNNMAEATVADESNSNMEGGLMVETVAPTIEVVVSAPVSSMNALTAASGNWYPGNAEFEITISDEHSGISNAEITVNGESLDDDVNGSAIDEQFSERSSKLTEETFDVSTSQGDIAEDGSYVITVSVTDNAGNVSETYSHTVYKDISVPEIIGFDFDADQYIEGAEDVAKVEVTDYGFYFREDTEVTVSSFDAAPSSGVKEITYYLVDIDGGKTEEVTAAVDANGKISFVVEANFKGQIYAKATDNVRNTPSQFVSPDRAILETPEMHATEQHISLVKGSATYVAANGDEFYSADVPVTVTITDTYSGLRSIEWSVSAPYDTGLNDSGTVVFTNNGSLAEGSESDWTQRMSDANLVTEISKTILVSHNSNDIVLRVNMTDRSGNTSSEEITFNIDKVAPVIEVEYNNNAPDAEYTDVYDEGRVATITVTERNFDPERIAVAVTNTDGEAPALVGWTEYLNAADPDESYYTATISYALDGDYTFAISGSDMAENVAPAVEDDAFTIDLTAPVISVTYANDETAAEDGVPADGFFNVFRTATIVITEHNFDAARAVISGTASGVDTPIFPTASAWSTSGDVHTATIRYGTDGHYVFNISFNDMAGTPIANYEGDEFTIDTTDPVLSIEGVVNNTAYSDEVAPEIIYSDINLDMESIVISFTGSNVGEVSYEFEDGNIENGIHRIYSDFEHIKEVDDIYTVSVALSDLAGNMVEQTVTFSVNRFGSTYDVGEIGELSGQFMQSVGDLVFTEINVTKLDQDQIRIRLTKNGVPVDLVNGVDFFVEESGGDGEWSVYTYRISESLFADNGTYSLAVYSVDEAGNINENIDESKEAEIVFGIDKTAPIVVSVDLESDTQYAVETKNVSATITDNLVLESVVIFLNNIEVQYTVNGSAYSFDIPESTELQTVRIVARDAAGNEYEQIIEDFLVSTSMFVRWYSNTPLFVGTLVGAGVVIVGGGAGIALGVSKSKKRKERE